MDLNLTDTVALVTGSSKGLGRGIAEALVAEGASVVLCARTEDELRAAADEVRTQHGDGREDAVLAVPADLTDAGARERLVEETLDRFGRIDALVNNAGTVGSAGTIEETSVDDWRNLFELNVFAVVALTKAVLPAMREQGHGRIVNVSSENGTQPYPDMIHYSASKGALDNFSKGLSKHVAADGILVNTVSPAFIETPLVEEMMEAAAEEQGISTEEAVQQFLKENRPHIELGRPGRIDEVGPLVAFLCSEKASFINGSDYRIDGGSVAAV